MNKLFCRNSNTNRAFININNNFNHYGLFLKKDLKRFKIHSNFLYKSKFNFFSYFSNNKKIIKNNYINIKESKFTNDNLSKKFSTLYKNTRKSNNNYKTSNKLFLQFQSKINYKSFYAKNHGIISDIKNLENQKRSKINKIREIFLSFKSTQAKNSNFFIFF